MVHCVQDLKAVQMCVTAAEFTTGDSCFGQDVAELLSKKAMVEVQVWFFIRARKQACLC